MNMKREIKFRAKSVGNGEWVYGDLHLRCLKPHIHTEVLDGTMLSLKYNVIPDTIGQFTGLEEKNGNEIYEDDIMQITTNIDKYLFKVTWNEELGAWCLMMKGDIKEGVKPLGEWLGEYWDKIEVIGNIYDNPELMEYK